MRRGHYLDEALRYLERHRGLPERYVTHVYPVTRVADASEAVRTRVLDSSRSPSTWLLPDSADPEAIRDAGDRLQLSREDT